MSPLRRVCVFTGSRPGTRPAYREAAAALGRELARRGIGLVYGGGSVGLMGVLADATLAAGGEAIGVIPEALQEREVDHRGLTELRVVPTMHVRKAMMAELSDAFVTLPGGLGTLEETFEVVTWAQLGIHAKPVGMLQVGGFYQPLLAFLEHAATEGFIAREHLGLFLVDDDPGRLLDRLAEYEPPRLGPKWLDREDV